MENGKELPDEVSVFVDRIREQPGFNELTNFRAYAHKHHRQPVYQWQWSWGQKTIFVTCDELGPRGEEWRVVVNNGDGYVLETVLRPGAAPDRDLLWGMCWLAAWVPQHSMPDSINF